MNPDACRWEVEYHNGTYAREDETLYRDLDRENIKKFRLLYRSDVIFETWPPAENVTGKNLIYRRRVTLNPPNKKVVFIVGWVPTGPVFCLDPMGRTYRKEDRFLPGDIQLYPPELMPEENFLLTISQQN